jgi:hypothetical protein
MTTTDRGYTILLSHLHSPTSKLPLSTLQGALAHHLATVSPLPTPLAATAITSPFYLSQPFTYEKLQSFSTAFRHASHLKYRALVDAAKTRSRMHALLGSSMQATMGQWVMDVLQGVHGGHPVLRLASCSGLLLGVEDLKAGEKSEKQEGIDVGTARFAVEDENVVALAEVMDTYAYGFTSGTSLNGVEEWEKEFQPAGQGMHLLRASRLQETIQQRTDELGILHGLNSGSALTLVGALLISEVRDLWAWQRAGAAMTLCHNAWSRLANGAVRLASGKSSTHLSAGIISHKYNFLQFFSTVLIFLIFPPDILSLALIFASQSLPLVTPSKVKALPLPILSRLLTTTISSTFKAGTFLSSVSASVTLSPQHQVHISVSGA